MEPSTQTAARATGLKKSEQLDLYGHLKTCNSQRSPLFRPSWSEAVLRSTPGIVVEKITQFSVEAQGISADFIGDFRVVAVQNTRQPYDWVRSVVGMKRAEELTPVERELQSGLYQGMVAHLASTDTLPYLTGQEAQRACALPGVVVAMEPEGPGTLEGPATHAEFWGKHRLVAAEDPSCPGRWLTANPRTQDAFMLAAPSLRSEVEPAPAVEAHTRIEVGEFRRRRNLIATVLREQVPGLENDTALAAAWLSAGIDQEEIRRWAAAGFPDPKLALELRAQGVTPQRGARLPTSTSPPSTSFSMNKPHQDALDLLSKLVRTAESINNLQHAGQVPPAERWSLLHQQTNEAKELLQSQYAQATPADGYVAAYRADEDPSSVVAIRSATGEKVSCYAAAGLDVHRPHLLVDGQKFFIGQTLSEEEWEGMEEHFSRIPVPLGEIESLRVNSAGTLMISRREDDSYHLYRKREPGGTLSTSKDHHLEVEGEVFDLVSPLVGGTEENYLGNPGYGKWREVRTEFRVVPVRVPAREPKREQSDNPYASSSESPTESGQANSL